MSPEAQLSKFDPAKWGDFPALDLGRLPPEMANRFKSMDLGVSTLPVGILAKHRVPELPPESVVEIEIEWQKSVAAKP
jgi:putative spermidine/putrescine transport system substrate-binding protein